MALTVEPDVPATRDAPDATRATPPATRAMDLLLLTMAVIWGVNFSVVKFGTGVMAPLAYNGVRVALAAVTLLAIAAGAGVRWPSRRDTLSLLGLGMLGNFVYQVLFIIGISRTRAGTAALVLAATPAFIAIIGRMRGVERVSSRGWRGIWLQLAGMACVVFGGARMAAGGESLLGNLLILAGALCWSLFTVSLKPFMHRIHPLQLAALTMTGGAVPLLIVASGPLARTDWSAVSVAGWGAVLYSGLLGMVVAYLLYNAGVHAYGPTRTAMFGNLQPIIALLVAWAWPTLHEVPTPWQVVGAVTIVSGLLLARAQDAVA